MVYKLDYSKFDADNLLLSNQLSKLYSQIRLHKIDFCENELLT